MHKQKIQIQSTMADLLFIKEIAKPSRISQFQAASNMQELHNLLKIKNIKSGRSKQQKDSAQAWLNRQGIDISPLVERVKKAKQVIIQKQELKKIQEDCIFYIPDMNYKKIDQYLFHANNYAMMNIIHKTMEKSNLSKIVRNRAITKFLEVSNIRNQDFQQKSLSLISTIKTQIRDQDKRQNYWKIITGMASNNIKRQELTNYFSNTINKKFWRIFSKHVKCLTENQFANQNLKFTQLFINSLQQLQFEYDSQLSRGIQSINYYLISNYLEKLDKKQHSSYIKDREHAAFWGKVFLFYRAGRRNDFNNLLSSRNQTAMILDFNKVAKSIDQRRPIKITIPSFQENSTKDVFRDQLIFALKGQAKYSSDVLSDPNSLDLIWILLRNLAIFEGDSRQTFQIYKGKTLESYSSQNYLTEQQFHNYFYLLAYEEIAVKGLNEIMDQDDYVHFLICLNENQALLKGSSQKIQHILSKQLILYARELISLNRSQFIYYLPLIPKEDRVVSISSFICQSNMVSTFNWKYLKSSLPSYEQFEEIVKITLEKHILTSNDYLTAADKYIQLLNEQQKAIRCLLRFLLQRFYHNSFQDGIIDETQAACQRYISRSQHLQSEFQFLLKFAIESRKSLQLLRDRKDQQIYQLIRNSDFVLLGGILPVQYQMFFDKLICLTSYGLEIYFKFLKNVIKGLQIYCVRLNKYSQLTDFIVLLKQNLEYIFSVQKYNHYNQKQEALSVCELIDELLYQTKKY